MCAELELKGNLTPEEKKTLEYATQFREKLRESQRNLLRGMERIQACSKDLRSKCALESKKEGRTPEQLAVIEEFSQVSLNISSKFLKARQELDALGVFKSKSERIGHVLRVAEKYKIKPSAVKAPDLLRFDQELQADIACKKLMQEEDEAEAKIANQQARALARKNRKKQAKAQEVAPQAEVIYQAQSGLVNSVGSQSGSDSMNRDESHIASIWPRSDPSKMGCSDGPTNSLNLTGPGITPAPVVVHTVSPVTALYQKCMAQDSLRFAFRVRRWRTDDLASIEQFVDFDGAGNPIQHYLGATEEHLKTMKAYHDLPGVQKFINPVYAIPTDTGFGFLCILSREGLADTYGELKFGIDKGVIYHLMFEEIDPEEIDEYDVFKGTAVSQKDRVAPQKDGFEQVGTYSATMAPDYKVTIAYPGKASSIQILPVRPDLVEKFLSKK